MFLIDFLFVLFFTVIFTLVFGMAIRRHRPGGVLLGFFLILLLSTWAFGSWVVPFGPVLWGVKFMGFLVGGFLFALLLTALIPPAARYPKDKELIEPDEKEVVLSVFNVFFWLLIIGLIGALIVRYTGSGF